MAGAVLLATAALMARAGSHKNLMCTESRMSLCLWGNSWCSTKQRRGMATMHAPRTSVAALLHASARTGQPHELPCTLCKRLGNPLLSSQQGSGALSRQAQSAQQTGLQLSKCDAGAPPATFDQSEQVT